MIRQPKRGARNVTDSFYEMETQGIALLNEVFGKVPLEKQEEKILIWLAGWEESTIKALLSAIGKVIDTERLTR